MQKYQLLEMSDYMPKFLLKNHLQAGEMIF